MPAAVVLARRLKALGTPALKYVPIALAISLALGLSACWGDYRLAESQREAAAIIMRLPRPRNSTVWFEGHRGFHHYMELLGAKAANKEGPFPASGDLVVLPHNNTNVFGLNPRYAASTRFVKLTASRWVATMCPPVGAGFYSHLFGPAPFVFGPVPLEQYTIGTLRTP